MTRYDLIEPPARRPRLAFWTPALAQHMLSAAETVLATTATLRSRLIDRDAAGEAGGNEPIDQPAPRRADRVARAAALGLTATGVTLGGLAVLSWPATPPDPAPVLADTTDARAPAAQGAPIAATAATPEAPAAQTEPEARAPRDRERFSARDLLTAGVPQAAAAVAPATAMPYTDRHHIFGPGDTLMEALVETGADDRSAYAAVTALSDVVDMRRIRPGQRLDARYAETSSGLSLAEVVLRRGPQQQARAQRGQDGFQAALETLPSTHVLHYASGEIDRSLYLAAESAGLPAKVFMELVRLYSFEVDFQRDVRAGDRFEVLFERDVVETDASVVDGPIVYANLVLSGVSHAIYRFERDGEPARYFSPDGRSLRKSLMKTPVDGARLTSSFGPRHHPVLGYKRAHQGVDFGAPTGTPIYAAGDGVIERANRYGSYGNYVRIRHNGSYKTAYAHMSRFARGLHAGKRVTQGEVIGYVGATGRVTGPHLHYEVIRDGKRVNPMTLDLPAGQVLEGRVLAAFQAQRDRIGADATALANARKAAAQVASAAP
ncbi:murein DD-endopeptidase MepM/ murein hydrolase activator NlpD [Rhodothalassium salexigens DSM 2132]|uniref:Murein DD-endopeptidase MepM/ murein hydrolase activator NlpD n=2 Tax=Rhodothalassium salexigens TaxID=1086 RepID=A0A4R2PMI7_RHOSA|nr:M23 family metallopeptidase [Rhodothalassium salexigens]MBB4211491.1 murein DD-endopeptidase MepM/ murein hydrolase activator NlpD [Rhodothalassium salexigens DSM 2132]MBK1639908.1 hypothetical protein [Rhodothalassium salexigens DSM 2132]TCP35411.1 murein DD-endopeptidase MepM/ murein hydrolase activator NlpD [Rhodothalassium salexigens DSM 2132]